MTFDREYEPEAQDAFIEWSVTSFDTSLSDAYLAGWQEARSRLMETPAQVSERERLQELEAIVREHIAHRELAFRLRDWLDSAVVTAPCRRTHP